MGGQGASINVNFVYLPIRAGLASRRNRDNTEIVNGPRVENFHRKSKRHILNPPNSQNDQSGPVVNKEGGSQDNITVTSNEVGRKKRT